MSIIPESPRKGVGGILHLTDALRVHPTIDQATLYNRCSSYQQAGKDSINLAEKTHAIYRRLREVVTCEQLKVRKIVKGVEEGKLSKMSKKRPHLLRAIEAALKFAPSFLIAVDLSRFIRAEAYHRITNNEAWPTSYELNRLREMIPDGIILVTIEPPSLTESQRHSRATKRTGKCGRPSAIKWPMTIAVLELLSMGETLSYVAEKFSVTKRAVQCFWDEWKGYRNPIAAYRQAYEFAELTPDGRRLVTKRTN